MGLLGSLLLLLPCLFVHGLVVVPVCLGLAFFFLEPTGAVPWALPMGIAPFHAGIAGGPMNTGGRRRRGAAAGHVRRPPAVDRRWQVPFMTSVALLRVGVGLSLRIDPAAEAGAQ